MNNKKPKLSKYNIATAKRLLKYVTETYKARFILVFVCIFLSAVASISGRSTNLQSVELTPICR